MRIVEIIGAPGAGKSTLTRALTNYDEKIQTGVSPSTHHLRDFPFFFWNILLLLPVLIALFRHKNFLLPQKIAIMAILQGWPRRLKAITRTSAGTVILDQGPLYMLSELLLRYGPTGFRGIASKWWERVCNEWANVLDMVICLDTSNAILLERVHARQTRHQIKDHSDAWAAQFLDGSRKALLDVLDEMTVKRGNVKVVRIDTSQVSLDEIVQNMSGLLGSPSNIK